MARWHSNCCGTGCSAVHYFRAGRPLYCALLCGLLGAWNLGTSSCAPSPVWVGPLADFYQDAKCANVGIHDLSLAACQQLCAHTTPPPPNGCDAVNWGPDPTGKTAGGCVLRACTTEGDKLHPDAPSVHDIHGYYCNGTRASCAATPSAQPSWLGGQFGNVRFEFNTTGSNSSAAAVAVPWRRRDQLPGPTHSAMLVTCANGQHVADALGSRTRTRLHLAFSPSCGPGTYHLYFLIPGSTAPLPSPCGPQATCPSGENGGCCSPGSNGTLRGFEEGIFLNGATPAFTADVQAGNTTPATLNPPAGTSEQQCIPHSRSAFGSYTEMEAVASPEEVSAMLVRHGNASNGGLLIFPEDAAHEIRMLSYIPARWVQLGPSAVLRLQAQPSEYLSFQLGLFASTHDVQNISVRFEPKGAVLQAAAFRCVSCGGVDWHGHNFTKPALGVASSKVLPLWMGLMLPRSAAGQLRGRIYLSYCSTAQPALQTQTIELQVDVPIGSIEIADRGDHNMSKRTRLRWLDSDRAQDDDPAEPYAPIVLQKQSGGAVANLSILGRSLVVSSSNCGLPTRIRSWGAEVLAHPLQLVLGQHGKWNPVAGAELRFGKISTGVVSWQAECITADGSYHMMTSCTLEAEGSLDVKLSVTPLRGAGVLSNATLSIDFTNSNQTSQFKMGFGELGSVLSAPLGWRWNDLLPKRSSMIWVGGGTAGMRLSLKGESLSSTPVLEPGQCCCNLQSFVVLTKPRLKRHVKRNALDFTVNSKSRDLQEVAELEVAEVALAWTPHAECCYRCQHRIALASCMQEQRVELLHCS